MSVNAHVSPSTLPHAYESARKQLGTFSGLLIASELLTIGALSWFVARELLGFHAAETPFDTSTAFLLAAAFSLGCLLATLVRHRASVADALPSYVIYAVLLYSSSAVVLFNRQPAAPEYAAALVCLFAAGAWRWFVPSR